jgi:hypothetical protein
VEPRTITAAPEGAREALAVRASSPSCEWTASTTATWLSIEGAPGRGNATVRLVIAGNTTGTVRTATVTIAGVTVSVTQAATVASAEHLQVEGTVSVLAGSCPTLSFRLGGRTVRTNVATHFVADRCDRIRNGAELDVRGTEQADGVVLATRVQVRGGSGGPSEVE